MFDPVKRPSDEVIFRALSIPGGYVYEIDNAFGPFADDDGVPPHAIVGAWKVNAAGQVQGGFIPNENYKPAL